MAEFTIAEGDTSPAITSTLSDKDDNPVDLQGATVRFIMRSIFATEPVLAADAEITQVSDGSDGSKGKVRYTWQEVPAAGYYYARWKVTFADGKVESFPNKGHDTIFVEQDVEATA